MFVRTEERGLLRHSDTAVRGGWGGGIAGSLGPLALSGSSSEILRRSGSCPAR